MKYNRRRFVKTVAAGVGGACLLAAHGAAFAPWRFFNAAEARLVDAITERIIPADQDPGASEAGVINFLDKQLASRLRRHQQTYRDGLVGVEETSRVMFEGSFVALAVDQQIEVLKALESGKAKGETWRKQSAPSFFRLICDHTMAGFYGGPQHGGNRGYASYKMLGIDYPQIIGQNRYRRKN
ncbi:MAG TPA: gluconate 2-dehydrogenase subunit 3 family protein [Candidatus Paceibacterota bacterium]|nr:gluconate 2-dehydrogenase subunit 3 family protein [Candidatus Paceibacterota bacterium]